MIGKGRGNKKRKWESNECLSPKFLDPVTLFVHVSSRWICLIIRKFETWTGNASELCKIWACLLETTDKLSVGNLVPFWRP